MLFLRIIDILLFVIFATNVLYLLFFSLASRLRKRNHANTCDDRGRKRIAVLIPAYKEDTVIGECVSSCLAQNYPKESFDVIVISDRMQASTDEMLRRMGARIVNVYFENSTKAKALNHAMSEIGDDYDLALVFDADNTVDPDFLKRIDCAFAPQDVRIVQAHRRAKNMNTDLALLDAVSEEINNSIFRMGHANAGLSAALIGSGMCFEYSLFKRTLAEIDAVGGFDRALELTLLYQGYKIEYLPDADVFDEKVQYHKDFSRQRRRWLSAQLHYFLAFVRKVPEAIGKRNWDFCDKLFQQMSLPRIMMVGFCFLIALALTFIHSGLAAKWWVLFVLLFVALLIAIPEYLFKRRLLLAIAQLPYTFLLMTLNLFKLRGANKTFIHTSHGVDKPDAKNK